MMSLQFSGQTTFTALGFSRQAIFFSLLRKAIIVVPLTLTLPYIAHLGVNGVYLAEPIADAIAVTFTAILFAVQFKETLRSIGIKGAENRAAC